MREVFVQKLADVMISLSSEVSRQLREYVRFNTVVANAYIKPLMNLVELSIPPPNNRFHGCLWRIK